MFSRQSSYSLGVRSPSPAFAWGALGLDLSFPWLWTLRKLEVEEIVPLRVCLPQALLWISSCNLPLSQSWCESVVLDLGMVLNL